MPEEFTPPKTFNPPSITPQISHEPPPEISKMEFKIDPSISSESDPTRVVVEDKSGTTKPVTLTKTEEAETPKEDRERGEDGKFVKKEEVKEEVAKEEPKEEQILKPPTGTKKAI